MVTNGLSPIGQDPVSIHLSQGSASFTRDARNLARLELQYATPQFEVGLKGRSLEQSVDAACTHEIEHTRSALRQIGVELAGRVNDVGTSPVVSRTWENHEEREWNDRGTELAIGSTDFQLTETLRGYEGASDAALVQEHVRQIIEQREANIRNVYRQVLCDVERGKESDFPGSARRYQ